MKPTRVLFVCHGNICRSPMAEFIMKHLVSERFLNDCFTIDSAATSTEEIGNGIYPPAQRCLRLHGITDAVHHARQITKSDYGNYDLLIGMDSYNISNMHRILGSDSENKIRMLGKTAIADPWYTDDFETTYNEVYQGCSELLDSLELKAVINYHLFYYPKLQAQDLVKLLFQNEFGPAHMIKDEKWVLNFLKEEYAGIEPDPNAAAYEPIGNGFVRANLFAVQDESLLDELCACFIRTANSHRGSEPSFISKLNYVKEHFADFDFCFGFEDFEGFLNEYLKGELRPVHHSALFEELYHPAYRVVKTLMISP